MEWTIGSQFLLVSLVKKKNSVNCKWCFFISLDFFFLLFTKTMTKSHKKSPSPGPHDDLTQSKTLARTKDDSPGKPDLSMEKDMDLNTSDKGSHVVTLEPFDISKVRSKVSNNDVLGKALHVEGIPINYDYDSVTKLFTKADDILEIRMNCFNTSQYEAWVSFAKANCAYKAQN